MAWGARCGSPNQPRVKQLSHKYGGCKCHKYRKTIPKEVCNEEARSVDWATYVSSALVVAAHSLVHKRPRGNAKKWHDKEVKAWAAQYSHLCGLTFELSWHRRLGAVDSMRTMGRRPSA